MLSRTRTIITCAAAAAAAGLAASLAAPALAASTAAGRGGELRFTGSDHTIGRITAGPTNTRTFAGYAAAVATGSATVLEASFTIPTLTCTTTDRAITPSTDVPVRDYKSASVAFVFVGCVNGAPVYYPGLIVNGTEKDYSTTLFAAGDVIDLTTKVSTNRTRVEVTDVTTGVSKKIIGAGGRARAGFLGDEGWASSPTSKLQHVPVFVKLTFQNCVLDGKALGSLRPQAYQRVNSVGTLQIRTGGFWPGGTAFTTHFEHT